MHTFIFIRLYLNFGFSQLIELFNLGLNAVRTWLRTIYSCDFRGQSHIFSMFRFIFIYYILSLRNLDFRRRPFWNYSSLYLINIIFFIVLFCSLRSGFLKLIWVIYLVNGLNHLEVLRTVQGYFVIRGVLFFNLIFCWNWSMSA